MPHLPNDAAFSLAGSLEREGQRVAHLVLGEPRPKPKGANRLKKGKTPAIVTLEPGIEERVQLRERWSHKTNGTVETHEHAAVQARREGALARLVATGAIDAHQLAAADQIAEAYHSITAEVAVRTANLEPRSSGGGPHSASHAPIAAVIRETAQAHDEMAGSMRKGGGALKNIAVQLPDITQGLLTGQKPMQVLLQQGAQIFQVAQMAEGGLKGFAGELGGLAVAFLPAIAAASVAGVALYRWKQQVDEDAGMKKFADGLGLTHKEMKKLGDVSVTTGDLVAGVWKTISDGLNAGGSGKSIMDYLFSPNDAQQVQGFLASIYGTFTGTYAAIVELWGTISTSVTVYVSAAAAAVAQFFAPVVAAAQWAGNGISEIFTAIYNRVSGWLKSIGSAISDFAGPILKAMGQTQAATAVTSAGSSLGKAFGKGYKQGVGTVVNGTNKFFADSATNAIAHPLTDVKWWLDIAPTNRWAMFDGAIGSLAKANGQITVTLRPDVPIDSLAVLELTAASVRVQISANNAALYDETQTTNGIDPASIIFLGLPVAANASVTVTITGPTLSTPVAAGALVIGNAVDLGMTEAGASIGITDFSKRSTDDFGVTTVVERGWAKRMTAKTKVDTTAVDAIQLRVASLRAVPAVWIGEDGYNSLIVYGFYKEFAVDLALETISYCSLTVEGMTAAR